MISHEREYTIFSLNVCFFTYLEPLEDLDLHTGLETRPVVSWAPREVLRISIRIIRKLMGAGGNTLFNANPEGSGGHQPLSPPYARMNERLTQKNQRGYFGLFHFLFFVF